VSNPDAFYKINELVKRWRVSGDTIYREIGDGKLAHLKVRGQFRIPVEAVQDYERDNGLATVAAPAHRPTSVKLSGSLSRGTPFLPRATSAERA
jgi:excisionase family DNA binding protein